MDTHVLNFGVYGFAALVLVQFLLPVIRDVIAPGRRAEAERRAALEERQIKAAEQLSETLTRFAATLTGIDQRLEAVERDQERMNELLADRLPLPRARAATRVS